MDRHNFKNNLYKEIYYLKRNLRLEKHKNNEQRIDIKKFIILLIDNDVPIPEGLINTYIKKVPRSNSIEELPF